MSRSFDDNTHDDPDDDVHDDVRAALRAAAPPSPVDDVDWMALHARITAAAQPTLAALTAARTVDALRAADADAASGDAPLWQPLAGWSPFGIPLAAAATVVLLIGAAIVGTRPAAAPGETVAFHTIEEEFMTGLGGDAAPLVAGIGRDDLLDAVLFYDGEDW